MRPQLVLVVEVVVVTGAGMVVSCEVWVVVVEGVLAQAQSEARATAMRQGVMIFFTGE